MRACNQCGAAAADGDRFCSSCGATVPEEGSSGATDPLIGRTIGGSYTLQEIVGVGGMGRVYRAEQGTLGRTVAIKVIHPHLLGDEQTVARFYTEARASSRLNHPNSVSIFDFGRTDDGILFLAMEFLKGKDLALVMHEEGPLPIKRVSDILLAVLDALGEAHVLDIVHRDLKPENIILRRFHSGGDLVKVVDFGLATIVDGNTSITRPGLVCGTPDYMSPEQGRGDVVDGRGDLYALGVLLFELLTDQLPYSDDTPTKVVLRHINDPVPDPRVVAPHRGIPDVFAGIAIKGLAKNPDERFQTAQEMAQAIKDAMVELTAGKEDGLVCPECGAENPATQAFCGSCGNRLTGMVPTVAPTPTRPISRPSFYPQTGHALPMVGRESELAAIEALCDPAKKDIVWGHIVGDPGVGKTRLLLEAAERSGAAGSLVVGSKPHPTGAPVAYGPIKQILAELMGIEPGDVGKLPDEDEAFASPVVRAGIEELVDPVGLMGSEGESRAGAVAGVLAVGIRQARIAAAAPLTVIVLDDLPGCDGLTAEALEHLPSALSGEPVLLLTAGTSRRHLPEIARAIKLEALTSEEATAFLNRPLAEGGDSRPSLSPPTGRRRHLPLYLEQLEALAGSGGYDEDRPPRLADAVSQRLERLDVSARRILQAAAVLGTSCNLATLREVGSKDDMSGLDELAHKGLVRIHGLEVEIAHPFIAELVEAFIPAEARKELHQRALEVLSKNGSPREVLAEHAYRAADGMGSFMVLEAMGDVALKRGDPQAAILAFRRALELARREMLETADPMMDTAIFTFSRKLGLAMERAGELAGADGVLREAMDLTAPSSPDRAKMYLALGRVSGRRGRDRDAMRMFGKALELSAGVLPSVESQLQFEMGRIRRREGEPAAAANAYRRAFELFVETDAPVTTRARAALELGQAFFDAGDLEAAREQFTVGNKLAEEAGALSLQAEAMGHYGHLDERSGNKPAAGRHYAGARDKAAEAGDAKNVERWTQASRALVGA